MTKAFPQRRLLLLREHSLPQPLHCCQKRLQPSADSLSLTETGIPSAPSAPSAWVCTIPMCSSQSLLARGVKDSMCILHKGREAGTMMDECEAGRRINQGILRLFSLCTTTLFGWPRSSSPRFKLGVVTGLPRVSCGCDRGVAQRVRRAGQRKSMHEQARLLFKLGFEPVRCRPAGSAASLQRADSQSSQWRALQTHGVLTGAIRRIIWS